MRNFLNCFTSIKSLIYFGGTRHRPSAIAEGLSHLKHSLRTITIDDEFKWEMWGSLVKRPLTLKGSLGSLSDFGKLEALVVEANMLLGSERTDRAANAHLDGAQGELEWYYTNEKISAFKKAFPCSLSFLHISRCSTAIHECVTENFFHKDAPLNLKSLHLEFRNGSPILPREGTHGSFQALEHATFAKGN